MLRLVSHVWSTWQGERRMRKLLRATPTTAIDDLPENTLGKLAGVAEPLHGRALVAPLSQRYCVYFTFAIMSREEDGPPALLAHDHHAVPFLITHGGQRALVDPTNAKFSVAFDYRSEATRLLTMPAQRHLLEKYNLLNYARGAKQVVFHEGVIELGEPIAVYGAGVREPDPDGAPGPGYRETGPLLLKLTGSEKSPLHISDDPRTLAR